MPLPCWRLHHPVDPAGILFLPMPGYTVPEPGMD
jgi:hypothetical protein